MTAGILNIFSSYLFCIIFLLFLFEYIIIIIGKFLNQNCNSEFSFEKSSSGEKLSGDDYRQNVEIGLGLVSTSMNIIIRADIDVSLSDINIDCK